MGYVDTANYKFKKPEESNKFDVADLNNALNEIDTSLYKVEQYAKENTLRLEQALVKVKDTAENGVSKADMAQQTADKANTRLDDIVIVKTWE